MKRFCALFIVLAVVTAFAAPAFAGTLVDFEKKGSSSIIAFSDYGDNLTGVTIEESTEQALSGSSSVKITVKADETKVVEEKAFFTLMLLASDTSSPMAKLTESDVVNFHYYMPEDCNISYIAAYICDETSWDYCSVGTIEPSSYDEWVDYYDEIDYIRFDEDTRGENVMPCAIMFECYLLDTDTDAYFYLDDFYFGAEDGSVDSGDNGGSSDAGDTIGADTEATAAPDAGENAESTEAGEDIAKAPVTDVTPTPENNSGSDSTIWIIVGCVVAAAAVIAAAVVIISKKKK